MLLEWRQFGHEEDRQYLPLGFGPLLFGILGCDGWALARVSDFAHVLQLVPLHLSYGF